MEVLIHRTTEFAILLSGALFGLIAKFGLAELLGEQSERSFLLLVASLFYIGLMWTTIGLYYHIAIYGDFIRNHLFRNIAEQIGIDADESARHWNWEDHWRRQYYESGRWEVLLNSVLVIGGYAVSGVPALALWVTFIVFQDQHGGLCWSHLSFEAKSLGIFNLACGLFTVPVIFRAVIAMRGE